MTTRILFINSVGNFTGAKILIWRSFKNKVNIAIYCNASVLSLITLAYKFVFSDQIYIFDGQTLLTATTNAIF